MHLTYVLETSDTILLDKTKGAETGISSYSFIGLANIQYKSWTRRDRQPLRAC